MTKQLPPNFNHLAILHFLRFGQGDSGAWRSVTICINQGYLLRFPSMINFYLLEFYYSYFSKLIHSRGYRLTNHMLTDFNFT